ncbi:MAG: hypothetical protein AAGB05_07755 [Pseudomonadota bacterium]
MADPFSDFLEMPNADSFRALRSAIITAPDYDMFSDGLSKLETLVTEGAHAAVPALVPELMPTWLLSARVHFLLSQSAEARGEADRARNEQRMAEACMIGLRATGDGTPEAPFEPVLPSDEYDLADLLDRKVISQRREDRSGRAYDVLECAEGPELWFDITDSVVAMIDRRQGA